MAKLLLAAFLCSTLSIVHPYVLRVNLPSVVVRHQKTVVNPDVEAETLKRQKPEVPIDLAEEAKRESLAAKRQFDGSKKSKAAAKGYSGSKLSKDKSNPLHVLKNKKTPVRGGIPQDDKTGLEKSLLGSQDSAEFADSSVLKPKTFWFTLDGNQKSAASNRLPFVDHEEVVENEIMPDNAKGSSVPQNDALTRSIVNKKQRATKTESNNSKSSVEQAKADGNSKAEKDDKQKGSSVQTGHYLNQKELEGDVLKKSESNAGNKPVSTIAQQATSIVDEEEGGASDTQKAAETEHISSGNDIMKSPSSVDSGETRSVGLNDTESTEATPNLDDDEDKADLEEDQNEDSKTFKETGVDDNETIDTATGDTVEANMENNSAAKQITDEVSKSESSLSSSENIGNDTAAGSKNENVESSGNDSSNLEEKAPGEFAQSEDSDGNDTNNENDKMVEGKTAKEDKVDDNEYIDTDTGDEVTLDNDGTGNAEGFEGETSDAASTVDSNAEAVENGQEDKVDSDGTVSANQNNETKAESGNDKVESALGEVNKDNDTTVQDFTESKAGSNQEKASGDENKSHETELQSFKDNEAGNNQESAVDGENKNNETKVLDFKKEDADKSQTSDFNQEEQKAIEAAKSYNKTNSDKQKLKGVARHQLEGTTVSEFASSGAGKGQAKLDHEINVHAENEKIDNASSQSKQATDENKKGKGVARHQLEGMNVNEFAPSSGAGDKTDLSKAKSVRIESNEAQNVAKNVKPESAAAQNVSQDVKSKDVEVQKVANNESATTAEAQKVSENIKAGSTEAQQVAKDSKQATGEKIVSSFAHKQLEGMEVNEFTSTNNRGHVSKAASAKQGEKESSSEEKTEFGDADVRDEFGLKPTPPVMLDSFVEDTGKLNDNKDAADGGNSTEKAEFAGDKTESAVNSAKESEAKEENQFDKVDGSEEQALNETELGEGAKSENLDLNAFNEKGEKDTEKAEFLSENAESVSNTDKGQQGRSELQFDSKDTETKEETLKEKQLEEGMKSEKDAKSFKESTKLEVNAENEPLTKAKQEIANKKVESEGEMLSEEKLSGETVKSEKDEAKSFDNDENLEAAENETDNTKEENKKASKEFKNQKVKSQGGLETNKGYSEKDNMEFMNEKNGSAVQKPAGDDTNEGSAMTPFGEIEKQKNKMLKQVEGILSTDTMEEKDLDAFVDNATAQAKGKGSSMEEFAAGEDDVKEDSADKELGSAENVDKGMEKTEFNGSAGKKEKDGLRKDQSKEGKTEAAEAFQLKTSEDSKVDEAKLEIKNLTAGVKDLDKEFASKVSMKKDAHTEPAPLREAARFASAKSADMKSVVKDSETGKVAQNSKASNHGNIADTGSLISSGNQPETPVKESNKVVETLKQSSEPAKEIWDLGPDNNPVSRSGKNNESKSYDKPAKKSPIAGEGDEFSNGPAIDKQMLAETFPNPEIATTTEISGSSSGKTINARSEFGDIKPKPMKDEFGKETTDIASSVPEQKSSEVEESSRKDSTKVDEFRRNSIAADLIKENALKIRKEFEDIKDTVFKPEGLFDKRSELNVLQSKIDAAKRLYKHYNSEKSV
eukprot:Seg2502.4 transcript_id=Seg2502.4/GoldUCD/mRNA.D3Y31 product="hypothetical protein" protein_id=Seg2502.4/GoldUCD/D3Y31